MSPQKSAHTPHWYKQVKGIGARKNDDGEASSGMMFMSIFIQFCSHLVLVIKQTDTHTPTNRHGVISQPKLVRRASD